MGLGVRVQGGPVLRAALTGELALLGGRLGLELDFPFLVEPLLDDVVDQRDLGDLRVGVRGLVVDEAAFELALAFRATAPTGARSAGEARRATLDTGVGLSWHIAPTWQLDTDQLLRVRAAIGEATDLGWAGTLGAWWSITEQLHLGLTLDGEASADVAFVSAAGGALLWELGRVRLSLYGGGALGETAREQLGAFTAGVSAEVLFGE